MITYAEIKNNTPTGIHKSFSSAPTYGNWLPVVYGNNVSSYNVLTQKINIVRSIIDNGTKVLYEELIEELPIETVRLNKLTQLKLERDTLLADGFTFNGNQYQTRNDRDIANLLGVGLGAVMSLLSNQPFSTNFITLDNTIVTMDATTTVQFIQTMLLEAQNIWDNYNNARDTVNSAKTISEIIVVTL